MPPVDLLLSATAPLSASLAREAEVRFAAPLHEIYGCSEAGQIAVRRTAVTEEWRCLDGITLRQDAAGTWASGVPIAVETLLSDAIELHDPERFLLLGRIADLVNIAGKRASLAHLNHQLNAIEGVLDGVFVATDDDGDAVSRLVAFAVAPGVERRGHPGRAAPADRCRPSCRGRCISSRRCHAMPWASCRVTKSARLLAECRKRPSQGDISRWPRIRPRCMSGPDEPAAVGHFPAIRSSRAPCLLREILRVVAPDTEAVCCEIRSAQILPAGAPRRPPDDPLGTAAGGDIAFTCSTEA